ncbi:MAG TPA: MucR family transcriptional regulator [Devosiaceae bacterium]|jgi:predicted transcriptional regulator|nr:MucR family transcriptional regulator [Devosiaceae bacterium]
MAEMPIGVHDNTVEIVGEIVAAYVSHNALSATDLPRLITDVFSAIKDLGTPVAPEPAVQPTPAVSVRKSITPDYLICLDDGKKFKSLRRHLAALGMTPEQYREKWGLPPDYPMVAPNYSSTRSAMAKSFGLGRKAAEAEASVPAKRAPRRKAKTQA